MAFLYIMIMIVGVVLLFWTGLVIGHVEGLYIGGIIFAIGLILFLIQTGQLDKIVNTLYDL